MLVLQLGFFAIAAHQRLQPHCNRTLPVFLQLFFCNRSHMLFFLQLFFCKTHYDKVAITHILVLSNSFFCNRSTSVVATTL
jgi:hypothetical protein